MYRVQLKPYEFVILSKRQIDVMISNGKLDKKKIWIEFTPKMHLNIEYYPANAARRKYAHKSTAIGWDFDKLCARAITKLNEIRNRINAEKAEISLVVYSSFRCPGINFDSNFIEFARALNISIDVDLYPIYKERYRYDTFPWQA
jgi:bifunctional ADP-heptose synthase (sugar kinase/adenylyltransferase)